MEIFTIMIFSMVLVIPGSQIERVDNTKDRRTIDML